MPGKYQSRTLISFQKEFPDDESCQKHLARQPRRDGFICPRCGHKAAWNLAERGLFDCKECRYQMSVTAGTIFHKTHVPLLKWYWLIYHMAMDKVGVSICEMQRILDIGQYRTAWLMAHKVRKAMAERDSQYSCHIMEKRANNIFEFDYQRKKNADNLNGGELPPNNHKLVVAWFEIHKVDLTETQ